MGLLDRVSIPFLRIFWPKEPNLRGYVSESDATPLFVGEATNRDYAATDRSAHLSGLRAAGQAPKWGIAASRSETGRALAQSETTSQVTTREAGAD